MSKKIVITKFNTEIIAPVTAIVTFVDDKADRVELLYDEDEYIIGNIYVAHVNDVVKNINAAFVEYTSGKKAYLQLEDNKNVIFVNRKNTDKVCAGDNIIIQIKKEPIKTKDAVCSTNLEFSGKYVVLTYGKPGIAASSKIKEKLVKDSLIKLGKEFVSSLTFNNEQYPMLIQELFSNIVNNTGVIFRTESATPAVACDNSVIIDELNYLFNELFSTVNSALSKKGRTCIKKAQNPLVSITKELIKPSFRADSNDITNTTDSVEIITDIAEYSQLLLDNNIHSRFYEDKLLPLYKLYSLESLFNEIQSSKIWLKCGGYLVIEYTEAMTVIDVNTGKCDKGKNKEDTLLNINISAATEIMRQIRLRNISGIIIVDFIDMSDEEHKQELIRHLIKEASKDLIKTSIMGMTRLNLVEMTRKKVRERINIKRK